MRFIYLIFISVILISCHTKRLTNTDTEYRLEQLLEDSRRELNNNTISIYKDSLTLLKAKIESSNNTVKDTSYLETSYSFSYAYLLKDGSIKHTISNKDSIETIIKYIYINKDRLITDSIYIHKIDTVYKTKEVEVVEYIRPTLKEKLFYISIGVGIGLLLIIDSRIKRARMKL